MSDETVVYDEIRGFLARFSTDPEWLDGDALLDGRVLDSLMALQLITYLEGRFGIVVEDDDLQLENFQSVRNMAGLVMSKTTA